ncbi:Protein FAR1-RELATED SEQUENCE 6 [Sesbania bispinosa]|nr:Protein FAR1-RELATED SEQUENCE 6 [Sesbania bispinosa]
MEGSCWDNIYEEFKAEYAYENDVEMFDVTDNPMDEMTDYSDTFTTNEIFDNRDELLKWVRETAMTHGFVVVIVRSDAGGNGRKTTLVLGCEMSGKYKPYKNQLIRKVTVSIDKWMTLPDMGYIIASRYNLVLVSLSKSGSMTFFPIRGHPKSSHQVICIGYVYGNHFIQVAQVVCIPFRTQVSVNYMDSVVRPTVNAIPPDNLVRSLVRTLFVRCLRKGVQTPLSGQQSVSVNQISLLPATFNLPFAQKHNNERLQKYLLMIKASNQQPPSSSFNGGIPCAVGTESSRVRE